VRVSSLEGRVSSTRGEGPIVLDDPTAYVIDVESASAWISWEALSRVLNDYTFGFDGAPIGDLEASREEDEDERDRIEMTGNLKSALGLAFEIEGRPEVMPDGRIRIRTESIQALDVPVGGLMHALGLDAEDMIGNMAERGVSFDGDDLILDASVALPPPRMNGRVTAVRVEDDGLALTFGEARDTTRRRSNHLWFHGGTIRIGRMTQTDADLRIVDQDPGDSFDFFSGQMNRQLAAGYAELQTDGGLTMHVPDYADIE